MIDFFFGVFVGALVVIVGIALTGKDEAEKLKQREEDAFIEKLIKELNRLEKLK